MNLTGCLRPNGYGGLTYASRSWYAHRLVYYAHHGPTPTGKFVCHRCDNRRCIAIEHLFLGSAQDNVTDMLRKGRGRFVSVLNAEQVHKIKRRLHRGDSATDIARENGVSLGAIYDIRCGKTWRHVRGPGEPRRQPRTPYDDRIPIVTFHAAE